MTVVVLESVLRVAVVTALALVATLMLRGRSAALRHWVLATGTVCALALPVLQPLVPALPVPVVVPPITGEIDAATPAVVSTVAVAEGRRPVAPAQTWRVFEVLGWIWLAGTSLILATLAAGFARLASIASRAIPVANSRWQCQLRTLAQSYRLTRPVRLLQSDRPALLVTWGMRRPTVLLPAGAEAWSDDRMHVVLAHELAHVVRHDWLCQVCAELLRALYWFNPLVWLVGSRLRVESERACDDAVLESGVDPGAYATNLLDVARGFAGHRRSWLPAPAIAGSSHLERRVRAMLNARLNRRPVTLLVRLAVAIAFAAVTLPLAALAQNSFSTFSGSVVDPMNGLLPKATLLLTNARTQAKYEVRADEAGRFEFVGLPPADYALQVTVPGFATLRGNVSITGQDVSQQIRLNVGELEETITVTSTPSTRPDQPALKKRPLPSCPDALAGGVGGRLRPPVKLRDVRPVYPIGVDDAGDEELVRLNASIATDGTVKDLEVVPPAHPAFAAAAVEAVRQWEFDETLLNCAPTEVLMRVSVTFQKE